MPYAPSGSNGNRIKIIIRRRRRRRRRTLLYRDCMIRPVFRLNYGTDR
jgi:hypothetical protein